MEKCYLCETTKDEFEGSWWLGDDNKVVMCIKCSSVVEKKFKAWVRSLRKPKAAKKSKKKTKKK